MEILCFNRSVVLVLSLGAAIVENYLRSPLSRFFTTPRRVLYKFYTLIDGNSNVKSELTWNCQILADFHGDSKIWREARRSEERADQSVPEKRPKKGRKRHKGCTDREIGKKRRRSEGEKGISMLAKISKPAAAPSLKTLRTFVKINVYQSLLFLLYPAVLEETERERERERERRRQRNWRKRTRKREREREKERDCRRL